MVEARRIPILTYHSIDESRSIVSTAPDIFRRQMKRLSETGMNAISLEAVSGYLADKKGFPGNTVVLTFDDGFQNFYTTAFPVLEQYGFKATVFLVTDYCGKKNNWPGNPPSLASHELMSWAEVRELRSNGIEFGAHTRTHPDLTRLTDVQARREIVESKDAIENAIGCPVRTFAYPYGKFNRPVREIVSRNFEAACSTNLGTASVESDRFLLERIDAYYLSRPRVFDALPSKGFDRYMKFRQTLRNVKGRVAEKLPIS
jgi:peptidoglycan/xylan/chitin deacetylase (PgdA/CDA1 family)